MKPLPIKGRGAGSNQYSTRFDQPQHAAFDDGWGSLDEPAAPLETTLHVDTARTVIGYNRSPDVPFDRSINPYRGCEHGCVYCFARPTHAYLGLSPGLDFESRLYYKPDAPARLRAELSAPRYRCAPLALGINTDAYQPIERKLGLTRALLEILAECRHPVSLVTKSALIERDLDLLAAMAAQHLVHVAISVTTLDRRLARRLEPRAAAPQRRLETLALLAQAGIPCVVLVAPLIPLLTDGELERILEAARAAGALDAGYVLLRLPHEVAGLFQDWLAAHEPQKAEHVMSLLRSCRDGRNYDATFGRRQTGTGEYAALLGQRFALARKKQGYTTLPAFDCGLFRPPPGRQMPLF